MDGQSTSTASATTAMEVSPTTASTTSTTTSTRNRNTEINDLPDVVLEYIFSYLSPYKAINDCRLVCHRWKQAVDATHEKLGRDFANSLATNSLSWSHFSADDEAPAIACRYSHSSCRFGKFMYIFGGSSSSNTTFNDLWTFNLATRRWKRIVAMAATSSSYPQPKSCSSLLLYGRKLILFGGWSCASISPMSQGWKIFNDVHEYDIDKNEWTLVQTVNEGPFISAHSACIIGDRMIVFGGLVPMDNNPNAFRASDEVWTFDLIGKMWAREPTLIIPKPSARYGHSQIVIDEKHMLILGGCAAPNLLFNDAWLLCIVDAPTPSWYWRKTVFKGCTDKATSTPVIGLHQACKIGDKILILNKSSITKVKKVYSDNGKMEVKSENERRPLAFSMDAGSTTAANTTAHTSSAQPQTKGAGPSVRPNARNNRQKLLEGLNKMEQKIKAQVVMSKTASSSLKQQLTVRVAVMTSHVFDISELLEHRRLTWFESKCEPDFVTEHAMPQQRQLYSLIAGKNEAIMFGGIGEKDNLSLTGEGNATVFNSIHILSAKRTVI